MKVLSENSAELLILVFLIVTFLLVGMLLGAKAKLLPSGPVSLLINGGNTVEVSSGSTLSLIHI